MKLVKSLLIIIIILSVSTVIGCGKENSKVKTEKEILKIVNNVALKENIITKKINIKTFNDINLYGSSLEEFNKVFQIECIRSNNGKYYAIFNSENNGWLYVLFESINNKYIVTDILYYEILIYKSDFEKLIVDVSSIEDVRKIDRFGNEVLYASSIEPSSFHNTLDGYKILIKYKDYPQNYVVSEIKIEKSYDALLDNLLDIDAIQ